MIRICAVLLWLALESAVKLTVDGLVTAGKVAYRAWTKNKIGAKLFPKWAARRKRKAMQSWTEEHGGPPDEILEEFNSPEEGMTMDSLKGAAKSKLVWLGVVQVLYGLFELWANGNLSADSAGPVISGALTIVLRAVTTQPLADKAK